MKPKYHNNLRLSARSLSRKEIRVLTLNLSLVGSIAMLLSMQSAQAATYYFDVNSTATGSGVAESGSYNWLTDSNWSADSTGSSATSAQAFSFTAGASDGDSAVFVAGADAGANAFTVNVNGFSAVHDLTVNSGNLTINTQNNNWVLNGNGDTATWTVATGASLNVIGSLGWTSGAINANGVTLLVDTQGTGSATIAGFGNSGNGLTKTGTGTLTLSSASAYTGATTVNGGTLQIGVRNGVVNNSAITVASGATLSMTAATNNTQDINTVLTLNGGTLSAGAGTTVTNYGNFHLANSGSIAVGANTGTSYITANLSMDGRDIVSDFTGYSAIDVGANSTLDISGSIFGVGGVSWGGISKYGNGTLELTGNVGGVNVGVVLKAGTLEFASGSFPGANPGFGSRPVYGADFEGNATLQWAPGNNQDISGLGGIAQIKISDGFTATFDTNGNNVTLGTAFALGASKTGALTKAGNGTLTLPVANTYTGATTINTGTISLTGLAADATTGAPAAELATTPITINAGATLSADATTAGQNSHRISHDLTLNGGTLASNGVGGNYDWNFAFDNGSKIIAGGSITSTISASIGLNGVHEFNVGSGSTLNITGVVANWEGQAWGTINKTGPGTLSLTYNGNGYGGLTLNGGTVSVGAGGWGNPAGGYQADFEATSTLQWGTGNTTDISAGGKLKIADDVTATLDTNGNDVTLGTAITLGTGGTGAVTKAGAGTLTISAANTYAGGTSVSNGTLMVNNTSGSGTGTGTVTVANGAKLSGTGTISGATTIQSGGIHNAGGIGTFGTQTFAGGITYNQGSIFEWDLASGADGAGYDKVVMTGGTLATTGSGAIFRVVLDSGTFGTPFWQSQHQWSDIFSGNGASLSSIFNTVNWWAGGTDVTTDHTTAPGYFSFNGSTSTLTWTPVPEPTSALVGLLVGAGLLRRRRN